MPNIETTPQHSAYAERAETGYQVGVLTTYSMAAAVGIGELMPQLDPDFSGDPVPQDKLERIIASPDRCQIVASDAQGTIVGAASMNTLMGAGKDSEGWLEDFIVDESARGSGVAEQMWQTMSDWCRSQGLKQFSFGTETWRPNAVRFYEKQGAQTDTAALHLTFAVPA